MKQLLPVLLVYFSASAVAAGIPFPGMQSSASLSGMQLELLDLRPDDGISPELQIGGMAWVQAKSEWYCGPACREAQGVPFSSELLVTSESSSFIVGAAARTTRNGLEASSVASTDHPAVFGGISRISGDAENKRPLFTVSPYTAVRLTGHYELDAELVDVDNALLISGARVKVRGADPGATSVAIRIEDTGPSFSAHESGSFSATWSNPQGRTRNLWGAVLVEAKGTVTNVPEPGPGALMVAGIGLLGAVINRRRTRACGLQWATAVPGVLAVPGLQAGAAAAGRGSQRRLRGFRQPPTPAPGRLDRASSTRRSR